VGGAVRSSALLVLDGGHDRWLQQRHRLQPQVGFADSPLVALLGEHGAHEADHHGLAGEDRDRVGALTDLLVESHREFVEAILAQWSSGKLFSSAATAFG